jgi:hypothetical protein
VFGIEQDRMKDWRIASVSTRTAQRFSIRYVLYPASVLRRHSKEMRFECIVRMVHRVHGLWFRRVKDLITNRMWQPGDLHATRSSQLFTFRRVMNCRPSSVYFRFGNTGRLRPCKQHRVCPFCWGRVAALLYRRFKRRITSARKTHDKLVLTCRVVTYPVRVKNFNNAQGLSPEEMLAQARRLRDLFTKQRADYRQLVKQLQRKTVGSAWRVLVNPQEDGWNIEVRQLFLARPRAQLPRIKWRGAKTTLLESVKFSDDERIYALLGAFMTYPAGLLTAYAELTAVYLQASYGLRLASGTGVFRTCGDGLCKAFKKDKLHGEATTTPEAKKEGSDVLDFAEDPVPV